jgi:hypothetical protein
MPNYNISRGDAYFFELTVDSFFLSYIVIGCDSIFSFFLVCFSWGIGVSDWFLGGCGLGGARFLFFVFGEKLL